MKGRAYYHKPNINIDRQFFSTESEQYYMFDLVLSLPPSTCIRDNGEASYDKHILVFYRPGDKQWRTKELDGRSNPMLYELCGTENWINEIEIKKLWHHVLIDNQTQFSYKIQGGGEEFSLYMEDWVESGNEIFKVVLNCNPRGYRKVASTHIFKLDFSSMTWVLLKSVDDHVLFLGTDMDREDLTSRKCYSTSSAYCSAADMGLERGCLFYTLHEDQSFATTVIVPCLKFLAPLFLPTWIMIPTTENKQVAGRSRRITDFLVSQDTTETSIEEENMGMVNNSGGELEASKQWDFLYDYDSTEEIARFLHPVDYIYFRPRQLRTYLSPWLISIFEDKEDTICNIVDPMHNNDKHLMKLSDHLLVDARIRFSKNGWLLLSSGKIIIFFYNLFTKAIRLPDLPDDYTLGGMSFSSLPTSPDCVVIAISNWHEWEHNNSYISFLVTELVKNSTGWTARQFIYESLWEPCTICYSLNEFMPCINNPVFYKRDFYCLDYDGIWKVLSKSLKQFSSFFSSYLVECDDKLLLVSLGQSGKWVDVYRLDDDSEMVWVKMNSLGKHALFISYTSSLSVIPPRSCMENKIYFPRSYGERILYYSLDTHRKDQTAVGFSLDGLRQGIIKSPEI
ncbi:hypothetical protein MKX01_000895 [Papaver californicum]|nr:hypothetical protein MKX01_000895 [Papaver californicum]